MPKTINTLGDESMRTDKHEAAASGAIPRTSPHRGRIIAVAAVVSLIAAIALANGGWHKGDSATALDDPLSAEIPHSRDGAQSMAAKTAAVIGGESMFGESTRHATIQAIAVPDQRNRLQAEFDKGYTPAFAAQIGLDKEGNPPAGAEFVSRTLPAGTTIRSYNPHEATVAVWCSGLFGLTGKDVKEIPVETNWFTITMTLRWTSNGWRLADSNQVEGPEPENAAGKYGQAPRP